MYIKDGRTFTYQQMIDECLQITEVVEPTRVLNFWWEEFGFSRADDAPVEI